MVEDKDPIETGEWLDALDEVIRHSGKDRAHQLMVELGKRALENRVPLPSAITTPFVNTIAPVDEKSMPGDLFMERRIRSLVRWNALAMVMRANDNDDGLGGHISSFSSSRGWSCAGSCTTSNSKVAMRPRPIGVSFDSKTLWVRVGICITSQPFMKLNPETFSQCCSSCGENMLLM